MKRAFNLSICRGESDFLADENERLRQMQGYDGLEVQMIDDPAEGLVDPAWVTGLHMTCIPCWYALWTGDEKALIDEFDDLATAEAYYGGLSRETLLDKFRRDLFYAKKYGAEYLVFHIAECNVLETYTENYIHTDEQICEACAEMLNLLFAGQKDGPLLLLENLWHPGMNLRRPEITRDMLAAVRYPKKGIMLDTGHLMNADTRLRSQEDAVPYIHSVLDAHKAAGFDLCEAARGIHLNASISGELAERVKKDPPVLGGSYAERTSKMFFHVFDRDQHRPFTAPGVRELVQRIAPEYLTTEFITMNNDDRRAKNAEQLAALEPLPL